MNLTRLLFSVVSLIVIMVNINWASQMPTDNLGKTLSITNRDDEIDHKSQLKVNSTILLFFDCYIWSIHFRKSMEVLQEVQSIIMGRISAEELTMRKIVASPFQDWI